MDETIFTNASAKAAYGIKRLYERRGYVVDVSPTKEGTLTVMVKAPGAASQNRIKGWFLKGKKLGQPRRAVAG